MIFTTQEKDALRLLISLGAKQKAGRSVSHPDELTRGAGIEDSRTHGLLIDLSRGPEPLLAREAGGAYRFTRHPESISLGDILHTLRRPPEENDFARPEATPGLDAILRNLANFVTESLDRISLGDLINIAHYSPAARPASPAPRPRRARSEEYLNGAGI